MAVVSEPAHLPVIGDVAPDQVLPGAVPRRPLRPAEPGRDPLDGGIIVAIFGETLVDGNDIRVGVAFRRIRRLPQQRGAAHGCGGKKRASVGFHGCGQYISRFPDARIEVVRPSFRFYAFAL